MRMGRQVALHNSGDGQRASCYIDLIGHYDLPEPSLIDIDTEKAVDWLRKAPGRSSRKPWKCQGAS